MTIDEAIEILDSRKAPPLMHPESQYNDAVKLGIEALKHVQAIREIYGKHYPNPLPGETEKGEAHSSPTSR